MRLTEAFGALSGDHQEPVAELASRLGAPDASGQDRALAAIAAQTGRGL